MDAHPAAYDLTLVLQRNYDVPCHCRRYREPDAYGSATRRVDGRRHTDDVATKVKGRSTRIAPVNRRIDLNKVVVGTSVDVPPKRGNDSRSHRVLELERISNGQNPIADMWQTFGELYEVRSCTHFDQRQIGAGISANDLCRVTFAVVGCNRDCQSMLDDVIVGDRVAVRRNEKPGSLDVDDFVLTGFVSQGYRQEPQRVVARSFAFHLHAFNPLHLYRNDGRLDLGNESCKAGWPF